MVKHRSVLVVLCIHVYKWCVTLEYSLSVCNYVLPEWRRRRNAAGGKTEDEKHWEVRSLTHCNMARSEKFNHVCTQNYHTSLNLYCHNLYISFASTTAITSNVQKFTENLLKLTEWNYLLQIRRYWWLSNEVQFAWTRLILQSRSHVQY